MLTKHSLDIVNLFGEDSDGIERVGIRYQSVALLSNIDTHTYRTSQGNR